ncbi:MAG TPA: hypothetical protein VFS94_00230 [Gemmatimonadales bacterium]|nr:hypothetical protein [Gemmatimonadales bacterium]
MSRSLGSTLLGAALALALSATPALAQDMPARSGFWFSGGLGAGSLGCDGCDGRTTSFSGNLTFGGTLSDRVLLGVGTTGWTKSEDGASLTVGTLDARVRYYPMLRSGFFLTGGLGLGSVHASVDGLGSETDLGLGALLGVGYDWRVGANVSVTPYWNGYAVSVDAADMNVGQLGVAITVH